MSGKKLVRITTVPMSMRLLLKGQPGYMRSRGFEVILISSDGPDWEEIPDIGSYPVYKVDMARNIQLIKDFAALWSLFRLFRQIKPDIVHTHTPKAGLLGMLAAKLAGVPVRMHTIAGMPLMESRGIKRYILTWAEKITYKSASMVYPNSFHLADFIRKNKFVAPDKVKVLAGGSSNGIDTDYFAKTPDLEILAERWRGERKIPLGEVVFVFVGRIVTDKGINELLSAFDRLCGLFPDITLLLVGPFEADLDPISVHSRQVIAGNKKVIHVGFQKDVRLFLSASDVLVFPSYREGFPNVPMQAGCMDIPSIVTDINGCNEIITDGVNGLIVPPKDEEALMAGMEIMIRNKSLRLACGANARARIVQRYKQTIVWEALCREYERLFLVDPL